MSETWNKTSAFEYFGVKLTNTRWSWAGKSEDGLTVAVALWQDQIKKIGSDFRFDDIENLDAEWRTRLGAAERIQLLKHSLENLGGRFRCVIAIAVDQEAEPREISRCFPQKDVVWQLDSLDEVTGSFRSHVLR